jgi:hypothetical protein
LHLAVALVAVALQAQVVTVVQVAVQAATRLRQTVASRCRTFGGIAAALTVAISAAAAAAVHLLLARLV